MTDMLNRLGISPEGHRTLSIEQNIAEITLKFDHLIAGAQDDTERACYRFQKALALAGNDFMVAMHGAQASFPEMMSRTGEAIACVTAMMVGPTHDAALTDALRSFMPEQMKAHSGARIAAGMVMGAYVTTVQEHLTKIEAGDHPVTKMKPRETPDGA